MRTEIKCCNEPNLEPISTDSGYDDKWIEVIVETYYCVHCKEYTTNNFYPSRLDTKNGNSEEQ